MLHTKTTDYPNNSYADVIRLIMNEGNSVSPRGQKTFELQPFIHHVLNSKNRLCSVPGRKANPFFNMAENMWIIGGHGNSDWICTFNNKLAEFQLDNGHNDFNAPYGRRIRFYNKHRDKKIQVNNYIEYDLSKTPIIDQLHHCYMSLSSDKYSRQAVISLWNPVFDNHIHKTKDRPCNTTIYFKIRDNKLNMTVCNRSNDVHLGLYGVNFVQFGHVQEFLAASLNVEIGCYTHISDSLHIYENSQHTDAILNSGYSFDIYKYVSPKILKYEDIDIDSNTKNLGSFVIIADQVISESVFARNQMIDDSNLENINIDNYRFVYCNNDFSRNYFLLLLAYDLYKKKLYEQSLLSLIKVFNAGFKDWSILGIEFCLRNKEFKDKMWHSIDIFLSNNFKPDEHLEIRKFFEKH